MLETGVEVLEAAYRLLVVRRTNLLWNTSVENSSKLLSMTNSHKVFWPRMKLQVC